MSSKLSLGDWIQIAVALVLGGVALVFPTVELGKVMLLAGALLFVRVLWSHFDAVIRLYGFVAVTAIGILWLAFHVSKKPTSTSTTQNVISTTPPPAPTSVQTLTKAQDGLPPVSEIEKTRLSLEERRLALEFAPSVTVVYEKSRLIIYNRGRTDIGLWGTSYGVTQTEIAEQPRMISPGDSYFLEASKMEVQFEEQGLPPGIPGSTPYFVLITTANSAKYTANGLLIGTKTADGKIVIHTQGLPITNGWNDRVKRFSQ